MSHRAYYSGIAIDVTREHFRITALDVCGRRIVVGCSDGMIRVYEDRSQPNGKVDFKSTTISRVFTKKTIDQVKVFPLQGIMVSLAEGVVRVHMFPSLEIREVFDKAKGTLSFISNECFDKRSQNDELQVCMALKRRVQFYRWSPREYSFAFLRELSLAETPRLMEWAGTHSICVAFKRDYKMVDTVTGELQQIFPQGRKGPPQICRMEASDEMLLVKNNQGICVDLNGKPTRTEPIEWKDPPSAILFRRPYILTATPAMVDVRNVENRMLVQTLVLRNGSMLASTLLAERMVVCASPTVVMQLTPVSPVNQVEELVSNNHFEAALQLIEEDLDGKWRGLRDEHRLKVQTQYAYHLYDQRDFDGALQLFQQTKTNPKQVLALFPQIVPQGQCRKVEHPVHHFKLVERKEEFLKATGALIPYLEHLRNRLSMDPKYARSARNSLSSNPRRSYSKGSGQEMTLPALIDMALLLVLLETDSDDGKYNAALNFIEQDTHCDYQLTEELLTRRGKFKELVAFFEKRDQHEDALELLKRLGSSSVVTTTDPTLRGPDGTIRYLKKLTPDREYQELVIKYAEWVVKDYPAKGLEIFTPDPKGEVNNAAERGTEIPPRLVLKLLKNWCGPEIVVAYLEKYLRNTKNTNSMLHNELIYLYLELIRKTQAVDAPQKATRRTGRVGDIKDEKTRAATELSEQVKVLRAKLISFLKASRYYKPEIMLARFPETELLEERAVVLSRLKEHIEALAIYVWDLKQEDKAKEYCAMHYNPKDSRDRDVYLYLMEVLINPTEVTGRDVGEARVDSAINLLAEFYPKIDTSRAVELLPDDLLVQDMFPILKAILSNNKTRTRRNQVMKSLYRSENLRIRSEYVKTRKKFVRIDNLTKCSHCERRIGNAPFLRYPPKKLTVTRDDEEEAIIHYACAEGYAAMLQARTKL